MFGAAAALDAAQRGLRTALIERADFAGATSAHSFKMVHGGIRYLQHADVPRLRHSARARSAFLRSAPHLVQPLPIVVPTYGAGMKSKPVLRVGMAAYDLLTADRNRGIADPSRQIPRGRFMSREEVGRRYPGLAPQGLTGAGIFCDGQMYNPPRLVLAYVQSAAAAGAVCANYVEATGLVERAGRVQGVAARDVVSGGAVRDPRPLRAQRGRTLCRVDPGRQPRPRADPADAVLARRLLHRPPAADRGRPCAHRAGDHDRPRRDRQPGRPSPVPGAVARRHAGRGLAQGLSGASRRLRDHRSRARGLDRRDQRRLSRPRSDAVGRGAGQCRPRALTARAIPTPPSSSSPIAPGSSTTAPSAAWTGC